jgi:hypothetical protein
MAKNKEQEILYKQIGLERAAIRKAKRKKKDNRLCKCGHNRRSQTPHPCPYSEDIYGKISLCYCCSECTHQCSMDI